MSGDKQILLGLTTTGISQWRDKVSEIKQLNIAQAALLPTALKQAERQNLYRLLEESGLATLPCVQLAADSTVEEIDYLVSRFKTQALTCYADTAGYALLDRLPKYNSMIFVENFASETADKLFSADYFAKHQVSGLCVNLANLAELGRTAKRHHKTVSAFMNKYPVKVSVVSGVKTSVWFKMFNKTYVDRSLDSLNDLAYLKQTAVNYLGRWVVMDLENSFLEQVEIKKFLENTLI